MNPIILGIMKDDINTGVSITDLGLNDFRIDLVSYVNENGDMDKIPNGLHTVIRANEEKGIIPGVIFVLKNINSEIDKKKQNMIYPFYLVYMKYDGEVYIDHLKDAYHEFNKETKDGKKMDIYSSLLEETIRTIIDVNEDSDLDSLFSTGGTTALLENINGLDDFELIAFVVIR